MSQVHRRRRVPMLAVIAVVSVLAVAACDDAFFVDDDSASGGSGGGVTTASSSGGSGGGQGGSGASSAVSSGTGTMICDGWNDATTGMDREEELLLALINDYRVDNGVSALTACHSLNRAAQAHSEDMRDNMYFSHTGRDGSTFQERSCLACYDAACGAPGMAENLASGNPGASSTLQQWQGSASHNTTLLSNAYTTIGIGRALSPSAYWTTVFGNTTEASCN